MRGAVLYGPRDVRFEERADPTIVEPTDAIIRLSATLRLRLRPVALSRHQPDRREPTPMGHEYCGIVEEVGRAVTSVKPGQFVIGSFFASDNTCPHCQAGYQTSCQHRQLGRRRAGAACCASRSPTARWSRRAEVPSADLIPSLLAVSDVLGTGWFAADAANVKPGATVVVVGDGAVGLLGVLSAKQMGAERIIAMSRHEARQKLAREFGATDIVTERGDEGVARIKELTKGVGADSVLECVGTQESMWQAIGVDAAGRIRQLRRRPARRRARRRRSCSSRTCTCTAAPPRCAATCPQLIELVLEREDRSGQGVRSRRCRSSRWPKATARWTSVARSRRCCAHECSCRWFAAWRVFPRRRSG